MRILILIGSYRKHGNTDQLVGLVGEELRRIAAERQAPLELETVYLGHQQIEPCRGCRVCFDKGEAKCPHRDDMPGVKAKMQAADGILVASPVYVDDVNGITKTWIDRLAHVCHRPEFAGKSAYALVTVASSPTSHSLRTLTMALRTWGFHIAGQAGFKMGALMQPETTKVRFRGQAEKIARELFDAVHERQALRPTFFSLMMFKIQQWSWQREGKPGTVDYEYWKGQGWFDPRCTFYVPHNASRAKVTLARLTGRAIIPFVTD